MSFFLHNAVCIYLFVPCFRSMYTYLINSVKKRHHIYGQRLSESAFHHIDSIYFHQRWFPSRKNVDCVNRRK